MTNEIKLLASTAVTIGFFHTLAGPDHYLPFIMMARVRGWRYRKTMLVTFLCGSGHIFSSVILGLLGVMFGVALQQLEFIESFRGNLAAWALATFGFVYMIWGIRGLVRGRAHAHPHIHGDGSAHHHEHSHGGGHSHIHEGEKGNLTPWLLFTIFVFGPCEPLIPILMYPAAVDMGLWGLLSVTAVFAVTTLVTMLSIVTVSYFGLLRLNLGRFERYTHAIAGASILACGLAIIFLGP